MAASNAFNVTVQPLDFNKPGAPTTKVYHGTEVTVAGKRIGRITSWSPKAYTREVQQIYEINPDTWGRPIDAVPGRSTGYTISIARTEMWEQEIEIEFGYNLFTDLMDQTYPFQSNEFLFKGSAVYRQWAYKGCWFTARDESEVSAEGNGVITVNGEVTYVSRVRLQ
jgi:hypothetical protein